MTLRKTIFWIHFAAGLVCGLSIAIMCFTGTVLAFEKELVAWAERDARRVTPPSADAPRLPLDELQRKLRAAFPDARPSTIVLQNDPHAAVTFSAGRGAAYHVNPYSGEVRQPRSDAMAKFMHTMVEWHRYLGFHGEVSRPRGKLINGICNLAFCILAVTGLYLWVPREWSWRALRPVLWFRGASGKARDFNWHNVIGLWSAPVLIVLTLTALPISFRWAGNLLYPLTGTPLPAAGAPAGPAAAPTIEVPRPGPDARPVGLEPLLAAVQREFPAWRQITLRLASDARRGGGGPRAATETVTRGDGEPAAGVPAATFLVREAGAWPRTATTTVAVNPFTAGIVRRTGYAELNAAQQLRSWTRFLHTGEALGWPGQLVAGLASLGGLVLAYTGFALAWRRLFGARRNSTAPALAASGEAPAARPR